MPVSLSRRIRRVNQLPSEITEHKRMVNGEEITRLTRTRKFELWSPVHDERIIALRQLAKDARKHGLAKRDKQVPSREHRRSKSRINTKTATKK